MHIYIRAVVTSFTFVKIVSFSPRFTISRVQKPEVASQSGSLFFYPMRAQSAAPMPLPSFALPI